jgi:hypothetical protein
MGFIAFIAEVIGRILPHLEAGAAEGRRPPP